ncbi:hypothetical protein [Cryobacterium sp. BB307]|uniref:hypothetical protein n=1 Tax=Cryobacterium sp. BB307 TaxID=2716317 RepID=UPI00144552C9|nr:hypothetical protein [Cryobacterium sp. BB307]
MANFLYFAESRAIRLDAILGVYAEKVGQHKTCVYVQLPSGAVQVAQLVTLEEAEAFASELLRRLEKQETSFWAQEVFDATIEEDD